MFNISKEDFIEEIKAELYGYEEISEEDIELYVAKVNKYLKGKKGEKSRISYKADSIIIKLKDESELFMMADKYYAAIANDEKTQYFEGWKL